MKIAIVQEGYAIFGIGEDFNAALADALKWADGQIDANDVARCDLGQARPAQGEWAAYQISNELVESGVTDDYDIADYGVLVPAK